MNSHTTQRGLATPSLVAALLSGALFGFGLAFSTMVQPEVVLSFLQLHDLGLLLVLGGAATVTMLTYQFAPRLMKRPYLHGSYANFERHTGTLDRRTVIGAVVFGIGWGISGVCPGPAITGLGMGNWRAIYSLAGIFAGAFLHGRFFGR